MIYHFIKNSLSECRFQGNDGRNISAVYINDEAVIPKLKLTWRKITYILFMCQEPSDMELM
jgi:hypothetical protein